MMTYKRHLKHVNQYTWSDIIDPKSRHNKNTQTG
jgi:hypothetical protein